MGRDTTVFPLLFPCKNDRNLKVIGSGSPSVFREDRRFLIKLPVLYVLSLWEEGRDSDLSFSKSPDVRPYTQPHPVPSASVPFWGPP